MPQKTSSARTASKTAPPQSAFHFSLWNWVLLALGLVAIVAGFVLLARGSTAAAPLILMLGFLVLIPWGIIR
jgi:uncharacterized membrane protein HdeD (DUF308 family)